MIGFRRLRRTNDDPTDLVELQPNIPNDKLSSIIDTCIMTNIDIDEQWTLDYDWQQLTIEGKMWALNECVPYQNERTFETLKTKQTQ